MSKKYNVQLQCPMCGNPIIISYQKYRPFKNSGMSDVRLEISVGCKHFLPGELKGYAEMGREFLSMIENRRIQYQELEERDHQKRLKEILGEYDPDSEYDPSRF